MYLSETAHKGSKVEIVAVAGAEDAQAAWGGGRTGPEKFGHSVAVRAEEIPGGPAAALNSICRWASGFMGRRPRLVVLLILLLGVCFPEKHADLIF